MSKFLLKKYLEIFSVFLLLLSGGGIPFLMFRKELFFVVLFFFSFLFFSNTVNYKQFRQVIFIIVSICLFLFVNYLFAITEQSLQKVLANLTIMVSAVFATFSFHDSVDKKKFINYLYLSLKIVMFHSLITFIVYPLISGSLSLISNNHYECSTFLNIFFYIPEKYSFNFIGLNLVRNQGIFWEPGVLQIFLNFLLFLSLFVRKFNFKIVVLTTLAILSTLSTTGLFVMMIQFVFYSINVLKKNFFLLPIFIVGFLGLYSITSLNITNKIVGDGSTSFQIRFFDLVQPVLIAFDHPLTGVGLDDQQYIEVRSRVDYDFWISSISINTIEKGATNSIMFFLATAGFPATILLLWMIYRQTIIEKNKKLFFTLIIFSLMTEPLLLKPFFFIFVISGAIYLLNKFKWKTY
jgi:hypothetical protein